MSARGIATRGKVAVGVVLAVGIAVATGVLAASRVDAHIPDTMLDSSPPTTAQPPAPPPLAAVDPNGPTPELRVSDVSVIDPVRAGRWIARVRISVQSRSGPLAGVVVLGAFTRIDGSTRDAGCVTGSAGTCTIDWADRASGSPRLAFTVGSVQGSQVWAGTHGPAVVAAP